MELRSTPTVKTRRIAISSRQIVLLPFPPVQMRDLGSTHEDSSCSIRPPRGRQSRKESEKIDIIIIVLDAYNNNTNRRERLWSFLESHSLIRLVEMLAGVSLTSP